MQDIHNGEIAAFGGNQTDLGPRKRRDFMMGTVKLARYLCLEKL